MASSMSCSLVIIVGGLWIERDEEREMIRSRVTYLMLDDRLLKLIDAASVQCGRRGCGFSALFVGVLK